MKYWVFQYGGMIIKDLYIFDYTSDAAFNNIILDQHNMGKYIVLLFSSPINWKLVK